jgi:CHASE2 domain-containing sensor protein/predicted Ser/Thr protein kinase
MQQRADSWIKAKKFWQQQLPLGMTSLLTTGILIGLQLLGGLEPLELRLYDQMVRLRPDLKPDPRLLVVGITDADIKQRPWPFADRVFAQALRKLQSYHPRVIGLDIYRDHPNPPGATELQTSLQASNVIGIFTLGNFQEPSIDPPPMPLERVGFNDLLTDPDGVVRRFLISGGGHSSVSLLLTEAYFQLQGLRPQNDPQNSQQVTWGAGRFFPLQSSSGGYQRLDHQGYQILLDYRNRGNIAPIISLEDLLTDRFDPAWVNDRIVLIGTIAPTAKDLFFTPYSPGLRDQFKMPGVMVHAQIVSQLLDAVEGQRPTFRFWPSWAEFLWLWVWAVGGACLTQQVRHPLSLVLVGTGIGGGLVALQMGLFLTHVWIPTIAPLLAFVTSAGGMITYSRYQVQQEQQRLMQRAENQQESIAVLQALIDRLPYPTELSLQPSDLPRTDLSQAPETIEQETFASPGSKPFTDLPLATDSLEPTTLTGGLNLADIPTADGGYALRPLAIGREIPRTRRTGRSSSTDLQAAPGPRQRSSRHSIQVISEQRPGLLGGRYQIQKVLGEGGFGVTYLALDIQRPGQPECVIKRLCPAREDARFLQVARRLFHTEAEILETLGNHEQIPQLLAYFEENYEFYLVQAFIAGHPLSQELPPDQRWEDAQVIDLLKGLLPILMFIHDRHIIHRDLKPSNIIRREDGSLVLIDFGAVKHLTPQSSSLTEAQTIAVGTPGYAAPEQMAGHPRFNSDLYALGMIAIQAMTGIPPHLLELDPETGDPNWKPWVESTPQLIKIVENLTEFNSCDRYPSATAVLKDVMALGS